MRNANAAKGMSETLSSSFRLFALGALMVLAAAGCTKKKELRNDVDANSTYIAKTDLVGKQFYLTRGIEDADDTNHYGMVPGFSEEFGIVEARLTEDQLQFVSLFNPNERKETATIVASYPITDQFDIKRETNDFGDQTNRIVEDRKQPWQKRQFIRVDWSRPTNVMSKFTVPWASEENTTLLEPAVTDKSGHITWKVETAVTNGYTKGTRVIYRTHLLPVKNTDFKAIPYTMKDFERFGYFHTRQVWKPRQKAIKDDDVKYFPRAFNVCEPQVGASCSTNKITWVLSKGYPEKYKEVTRRAVREWNQVFQQALGRSDDVVVLDESIQADISDPRYHVIAYYEPRVSYRGLLGVAQGIDDPRTGEVIAARSTIFEDGIQLGLGQVDEVIDILNSNDPIAEIIKTDALRGNTSKYRSPFTGAKVADHVEMLKSVIGANKIKSQTAVSNNPMTNFEASKKSFIGSSEKAAIRAVEVAKKAPRLFAFEDFARVKAALPAEEKKESNILIQATGEKAPNLGGMEEAVFFAEKRKEEHAKRLEMAEHGVHGAELVEEATIRFLLKLAKTQTPAQMKSAKEQIKEEVAQLTFYTTLLHELGHNFGLRHNFEASADEENFMPEYKTLKARLAAGDKDVHPDDLLPFQFSSVMDYGGDFYSQIGGLGEYDKAAIKYVYNRGANRDAIALKKDPISGEMVARYKFCTDHEADEKITCRRHDKGKNVSEITTETITSFNRSWPLIHFRRDRALFGNGIMGYNLGTMISVRQVMDELIYSFVVAEKIDPVTKARAQKAAKDAKLPDPTTGLCENKFIFASVIRGEIANICSPVGMEQAGVDPTDFETLVNALFDEAGQLRKKPSEYVPYGMADLMYANLAAQEFFQSVLGSTEPGPFLALPQQRGQPFRLIPLDESIEVTDPAMTPEQRREATDVARLKALAAENGVGNVDQFVKQYKGLVTDLKIGGAGRPFSSTVSSTAGFTRIESVGSFYDKQAAILALGFRDIGVWKYLEKSMTGNAYAFPQTKKWATSLFTKLLTGNPNITIVPAEIRMRDPKAPNQPIVVPAIAQASLNTDTQALSTFVSFGLLTSDLETSFLDKLRICGKNEGQCSESAGDEVVEAKSASGGDVFRAAQTAHKDSIAFALVSEMKGLSDEREKWKEIGRKAGEAQADNLLKLDAGGELRQRLEENFAKVKDLKSLEKMKEQITAVEGEQPSAWSMVVMLTQQIDKVPLFTTLEVARGIQAMFADASQKVDGEIKAMKTEGICEVPNVPDVPALPGEGTPVITINDELKALMSARAKGQAGNLQVVLQNMAPANGNKPAPTTPSVDDCMKSPAAQRRATLVALQKDLVEASKLVGGVLEANVNGKAAPLQFRNLTNQMESKEGFIRLIRNLADQTGGL